MKTLTFNQLVREVKSMEKKMADNPEEAKQESAVETFFRIIKWKRSKPAVENKDVNQ